MLYKLNIDNLIQIAPLWHIEPYYFELFTIKNYIVMGDLENPETSINLTKAIPVEKERSEYYYSIEFYLREQYMQQQCVLDNNSKNKLFVPTSLARQVPMPYSLMSKLPDTLRKPLLKTAFEQCVGRVPSEKSYAKNISVVNHKTILNYCSNSEKQDILENDGLNVISRSIRIKIKNQVDKFLETANYSDKNDCDYRKRLQDIAQAIYLITNVEYVSLDKFETFNVDNLMDIKLAEKNWNENIKKNNSDLTPCYDLLTLIVKNVGYVPSKEECKTIVSTY